MSLNGLAAQAVTQLRVQRQEETAPTDTTNNAAALDNAISSLSMYIPAETMALYLAVSSSLPAITTAFPEIDPSLVYWSFVWGFSPGLFTLAYFVKLAKNDSQLPTLAEFPWFRLISSIIAFGVWGRCVPGNPFAPTTEPGRGVFWGLIAMIVSIILPAVEAIWTWLMKKRKSSKSPPRPHQD